MFTNADAGFSVPNVYGMSFGDMFPRAVFSPTITNAWLKEGIVPDAAFGVDAVAPAAAPPGATNATVGSSRTAATSAKRRMSEPFVGGIRP